MHVRICGTGTRRKVAQNNNKHVVLAGQARGASPKGQRDKATLGARLKVLCTTTTPTPFGDTVP